ncbi:Arylsulfatase A [Shimia gijangensis]|uniref:Arylsulfatase A n=1 Tax=Shimia gijangensis TaxID=1470563 RepID=A0A1M6PIC3_9RHOB|nr:sulfatase-like hydrolase/transferase [Shimia gijangensis]SHK07654.1 Arylsulfatase A [Shimia gijangensis]
MTQKKPNILLIYVDNQPADMMGCSGNDEVHTPNLDGLANKATRFSEAFSPNAMCSPSRASMLTGLIPSQHGIHTWLDDDEIDNWPDHYNALHEFETLPEQLRQAGYNTALIGKYHLGVADQPQNGFDHWVTMQIGHVLSFYDNKMLVNGDKLTHPGHSVEFFSNHAVDYIKARQDQDDPFFMYLTYPAPYGHWPSIQGEPQNPFADLYKDTAFHSVPREGLSKELIDWMLIVHDKVDGEDAFFKDIARIPNDLTTLRNYYSQMSMVDHGVGQVLEALEQQGLSDDTLVIYTSDHGMSLGHHGFWGHGEDTWPSNTHRQANHIPLIVKAPEESRAQVRNNLVGTTDIHATVLDFAGLPAIDKSPGHSLRPLMQGDDVSWDNAVFMEQEETRAIRTDKWLLMRRVAPCPYEFKTELYDLEADPDERVNVANDPAYADALEAASDRLDTYFSTYCDPKWDLWKGGTLKSNSTRPFLWKEIWGEDWRPEY